MNIHPKDEIILTRVNLHTFFLGVVQCMFNRRRSLLSFFLLFSEQNFFSTPPSSFPTTTSPRSDNVNGRTKKFFHRRWALVRRQDHSGATSLFRDLQLCTTGPAQRWIDGHLQETTHDHKRIQNNDQTVAN